MSDYWYAGGGIGLGPRPPVPSAEPYPEPVVSSRDGVTGPSKTAVKALVKLAEAHGWATEVTYAKGSFPHASTGRPGAPKESLAVRMARGTQYAVAVYVGGSTWSWETLVLMSPLDFQMFSSLGAFMDYAFGLEQGCAIWPWARCPIMRTAAWHAPYIRSW
jgi:hypothetical protein